MAPPPPPPPPPPLCLPFGLGKPRRRFSYTPSGMERESYGSQRSSIERLQRTDSYSPTETLASHVEKLSFSSDTASYVGVPEMPNSPRPGILRRKTTKGRGYTMPHRKETAPPTEVTTAPSEEKSQSKFSFGYGWSWGRKEKERLKEMERYHHNESRFLETGMDTFALTRDPSEESHPPMYESPHRSPSSHSSAPRSAASHGTETEYLNPLPPQSVRAMRAANHSRSNSHGSGSTRSGGRSRGSGGSGSARRPSLVAVGSSDTLVGSAYERKRAEVDAIPEHIDTGPRLNALRELMNKDSLDYYVIPTEDPHGSEYIAVCDKRREWVSGFTGSAGEAIISKTSAYLVTDSRYWIQAHQQLDEHWELIEAGSVGGPRNWVAWLSNLADNSRIGIDSRLISYEKATELNQALQTKNSRLVYPPQNFVDLIWSNKPQRSKEPIYVQPYSFTGREASAKLAALRAWIKEQAPSVPTYTKTPPKPTQEQTATLVSSLPNIAYLLNLRGDDIPFNPVFHSYLFVGLNNIVLFVEPEKVTQELDEYLHSISVERLPYNEVWSYLRRKPWGEGKVIITPQTSYAISLILTSFRYTVLPSPVDDMKAIKNEVELEGLRIAYRRDGAAYVKFLAWLEEKMLQGYEITEYEAAWRLTEYRRKGENYMGLAYENISASGPNAALPHYSPRKGTARFIDRETPYLNDSGGQYRDGTCDTTRTVHFGRPTDEQSEAFTRVLQGHIAIDSAIFPEGTSGYQMDVLARKALWQDGLNYMHGTGHGFGSFLNVHEGPQGFSSHVPLVPGHVVTNEPGFYKANEWGVRIESALIIKRVDTKHDFNGKIWLGFERLTCVPIQTKMVKESMLSKQERQWLKNHNKGCLEILEPYLHDDKRALRWLRREAERGVGVPRQGPGGISIDWD